MKVRVVVEYDPEVNRYAVWCPELPGCTSAGDTEAKALQNIEEAITLYLEPSPLKIGPGSKIYEVEVGA